MRPTDIPGFVPAWDDLKARYGANARRALALLNAHAAGLLRVGTSHGLQSRVPYVISDRKATRNAALILRGKR